MPNRLLLLRAARPSVDPVSEFYLREANDLSPVNILDEGVMGHLRTHDWAQAVEEYATLQRRLSEKFDNKITGTLRLKEVRLAQ